MAFRQSTGRAIPEALAQAAQGPGSSRPDQAPPSGERAHRREQALSWTQSSAARLTHKPRRATQSIIDGFAQAGVGDRRHCDATRSAAISGAQIGEEVRRSLRQIAAGAEIEARAPMPAEPQPYLITADFGGV